ncbi:Uncharacterised protein [Chryseobacterium taklimakanense]|uniref:DUF3987 domain-containing protein n=1 Tax=Chryseobacterium taklimakanense TaxID=536441 RepID=A0A239XP36_9FLAO|nr:DUF3987 domain-containing protein [Chryseobacterium taklimakanense]SNV48150.1 Uncharacterised protein [Chryseobacterium taklimakanense]
MNAVRMNVDQLKESIKESFKDDQQNIPLEVFPEVVREIISEKTKQSLAVEFLFASALAAVSIAIGNSFKVELIPGMFTNASLYVSVVAESGSGKTEGIESFLKPLLQIESENNKRFLEEEKQYQKNKALPLDQQQDIPKPYRKQRIMQDLTAEAFADRMEKNPGGLGGYVDEIKGFVTSQGQYKGGKGNDRQFWLSVWNGKKAMKDRVNQSIFIENVFFTLIGGIQKEEASELFMKMFSDGFAPRFLFVVADNLTPLKWNLDPVDASMDATWDKIIRSIIEMQPENNESRLVKFERDAAELLVNWRNNQSRANNFAMRLFDAKLQIYAIRFSLVLHILKRAVEGTFYDDDLIELETAENALKLVKYFRDNAEKMTKAMKLDDPLESLDANKLTLYDMLPDQFTTGEGEQIAKNNKLLGHTAFNTFLKNKRLFKKLGQGNYEKLIADGNDN